jgi:hypothetical protein
MSCGTCNLVYVDDGGAFCRVAAVAQILRRRSAGETKRSLFAEHSSASPVKLIPFFRLCAGGETRRWGHWQKRGPHRSTHSG